MIGLWQIILPELRGFPAAERRRALRLAREGRLQAVELVVMAIWLVLVTTLMRNLMGYAPENERLAYGVLMQLVVTAPLLLLVFLPIFLRRLRRGLRMQLEQDEQRNPT
ncbi:MAG: hypothetical protein OEV31_05840 [Gammaproteobacteria bacterium]|nr:hypothetical protein [Gammaproteobacteria bacterium]